MNSDLIATSAVTVDAPASKVWEALTKPELIQKYMMGAQVVSDWKEGSDIVWKGEFKGKPFEDKGKIITLTPEKMFAYTHFSPMEGKPDTPENYHTVNIELKEDGSSTHVILTQNNNATDKSKQESEKNWNMMLESLKKVVEA